MTIQQQSSNQENNKRKKVCILCTLSFFFGRLSSLEAVNLYRLHSEAINFHKDRPIMQHMTAKKSNYPS